MRNLLFFFGQLFFASFLLCREPSLQEKLRILSNEELFELSKSGTLGKIAREESGNKYFDERIFGEKSFDLVMKKNYQKDRLQLKYLHLTPLPITWRISRNLNALFKQFKEDIIRSGLDAITEESSKLLAQRRLNKEFGGLYYGFQFSRDGRNTQFHIKIDLEVEKQIMSIMEGKTKFNLNELSAKEKEMIVKGKLSSEEMTELKKLKLVSQIFSSNSPYKETPGGWKNNKINPLTHPKNASCPFTAYCGEHARTTLEFTRQMEDREYLKHFSVQNILIRNHLLNNHAGVAIKNKRTGEIFILDSWSTKGGTPLKILPLSSWAYWIMKGKKEILNTCLKNALNQLISIPPN